MIEGRLLKLTGTDIFDINELFFWICVLFSIRRRPPIKSVIKEIVLRIVLTLEMPITVIIGSYCMLITKSPIIQVNNWSDS